MEIQKIEKDPIFSKAGSQYADIFSGDSFALSKIKAVKDKSINITSEDNGVKDETEINHLIYIISGSFRITVLDQNYSLKQGETLTIKDPPSYNIYCLEEGEFLFFTTSQIEETFDTSTLDQFNKYLDEYDPYTFHHSERVGHYAELLANALLPGEDNSIIHYAANYHDVGKTNIPVSILNKKGKLTAEEFEIIKKHPADSYNLIKPIFGEKIALVARHHHERLDGTGYPDHLKGTQITLPERILAVSDVFDALTSDRSYRKGYSTQEAFKIIDEEFQGKLDKNVVSKLKEFVAKGLIVPHTEKKE
jgi:HD-GYP domain-containing protein (c-di-GMP phosphodiesterase class II)